MPLLFKRDVLQSRDELFFVFTSMLSAILASVVCKDGEREILTQDGIGANSGWKMTLI